ncbi:MAG: glucose-6-phosphate isomerase [Puniceicoccaceae bacterium]|nr:MAG: glucose-6-phosphate isomerase [Puniceicoccaceae bacterium]
MAWSDFTRLNFPFPEAGLAVDLSRLSLENNTLQDYAPAFERAFAAMRDLEAGAIANPDEGRMVGHYWLRNPGLAPSEEVAADIRSTLNKIKSVAARVHLGEVKGASGPFTDLLVIGIGGSALGPQFVAQALGHPATDKLRVHFFDNTDPDGFALVLDAIGDRLPTTLCLVISKSGGTPETRNGMLAARAAFEKAGLEFARHAIAITGTESALDQVARKEDWLDRFPMWDWVGGRTSELGPVGLLPAALQGLPIQDLLDGGARMDALTRQSELPRNPAALLALAWHHATDGRGARDMVILPYKDRLLLLSRYLQQLVMESLGKEKDLDGKVVHQGIAVYGNKGSTDQHAYVQQLREGVPNFFATFIEVLRDGGEPLEIDPDTTPGDYLSGFLLGTRDALSENGRPSLTLTVTEVGPETVGGLIALFERAVGLYASLVHINAYHQPGVEAGKKAANAVLDLQRAVIAHLRAHPGKPSTAADLAGALGADAERLFKILDHLAANPGRGIRKHPAEPWHQSAFSWQA